MSRLPFLERCTLWFPGRLSKLVQTFFNRELDAPVASSLRAPAGEAAGQEASSRREGGRRGRHGRSVEGCIGKLVGQSPGEWRSKGRGWVTCCHREDPKHREDAAMRRGTMAIRKTPLPPSPTGRRGAWARTHNGAVDSVWSQIPSPKSPESYTPATASISTGTSASKREAPPSEHTSASPGPGKRALWRLSSARGQETGKFQRKRRRTTASAALSGPSNTG